MRGHEIIETYIPYEYREAFIRNMFDKEYLDHGYHNTHDISTFITGSFHWSDTPEGYFFWRELLLGVTNTLVPIDRVEEKYYMKPLKFI